MFALIRAKTQRRKMGLLTRAESSRYARHSWKTP